VLVGADRLGLALGVEMIVVIAVVMVGYWLVQRRARRWLQVSFNGIGRPA
jgi:putative spermidine/putrescine transport system permease protein